MIEEKVDGAGVGLSFDGDANLLLQFRGHYLEEDLPRRERHFNLFRRWVRAHQDALFDVIGDRYLVFGEWLYAKHSVYYDALPAYFLEYDVWDRSAERFLSTPARGALLAGLPVVPVPVLFQGEVRSVDEVASLIRPSLYKTSRWRESLAVAAARAGADPAEGTDPSDFAEGVYLKDEDGDCTVGRYKFIRPSFVAGIVAGGAHWADRPLIPNGLAPGVDIFAPTPEEAP